MNNSLVFDAVERLVELLKLENAALRGLDFQATGSLLPEKELIIATLEDASETLLPEPFSAGMLDLVGQLRGLILDNQTLLGQAIEVQARIVQILGRAATSSSTERRYAVQTDRRHHSRVRALAFATNA